MRSSSSRVVQFGPEALSTANSLKKAIEKKVRVLLSRVKEKKQKYKKMAKDRVFCQVVYIML
jgi:hypothetical protein